MTSEDDMTRAPRLRWGKEWWKSKTIWIAILAEIPAALEILARLDVPFVTPEFLAAVGPVVFLILRLLTGKPIAGSPASRR